MVINHYLECKMGIIPIPVRPALVRKYWDLKEKGHNGPLIIISFVYGTPVCPRCPPTLQYLCCFLHEETGLGKLRAHPESHEVSGDGTLPSVSWTSKYLFIEKQCLAWDCPLPCKWKVVLFHKKMKNARGKEWKYR